MAKPIEGTITIKDGKVTFLKNISDFQSAVTDEELWHTLHTLAQAGWRLTGDYELRIEKDPPESQ